MDRPGLHNFSETRVPARRSRADSRNCKRGDFCVLRGRFVHYWPQFDCRRGYSRHAAPLDVARARQLQSAGLTGLEKARSLHFKSVA